MHHCGLAGTFPLAPQRGCTQVQNVSVDEMCCFPKLLMLFASSCVAGSGWYPEWLPPCLLRESLWVWWISSPDTIWTSCGAQTQTWIPRVNDLLFPFFLFSSFFHCLFLSYLCKIHTIVSTNCEIVSFSQLSVQANLWAFGKARGLQIRCWDDRRLSASESVALCWAILSSLS